MRTTPYFLFADKHRDEERDRLAKSEQEGAGKASAADVAKALGERWRALTDEERADYKDQAAVKNAEAAGKPVPPPSGGSPWRSKAWGRTCMSTRAPLGRPRACQAAPHECNLAVSSPTPPHAGA
jgi:hypothetical protein